MAERLVTEETSVEIAADVDSRGAYDYLLKNTHDVEGISGYKVGLTLGLGLGLGNVVEIARQYTKKNIIYDHQKAGNDIPETGSNFARVCKKSGIDAIILFPFTSPTTELRWIKESQDAGLTVLVGGHMTHEKFLHSEGGFIADDAPERIYSLAAKNGVRDFVVPGNKAEYVEKYRSLLEEILGPDSFALYAPGFITQKGEISEFAKVAGDRWHAIVGSAIYKAADIKTTTEQITSQIK